MTLSNIYQDHHKEKDQSVLPSSCCWGPVPVFVSNHPKYREERMEDLLPPSLLTSQSFIGQGSLAAVRKVVWLSWLSWFDSPVF